MHTLLETARLEWRNAHTPVSSIYDDVFFSADDGLAESQYNYIDNNALPERFQQLHENDSASHFTIGETGFGTGLNFLLAWQCWQDHGPQHKKLYYLSTERFPLNKDDLQQSLQCWPTLQKLAMELCKYYPLPLSGIHTIELSDNVTLVLILGDASEGLQWLLESQYPLAQTAYGRAVDAWFLDGFAPDKNPDMWQDELFQTIARLSKRGTTFASFTSAGIVRRGLKAAGFEVRKVKGFGRKREMICGTFLGLPFLAENTKPSLRTRPWGHLWPIYRQSSIPGNVIIIGAGIAGSTTALLLATAGLEVTLIDSHAEPLQGASGNPQAMLFPKLSHEAGTFAEFNLASYLYALRFYARFFPDALHHCGMLQLLNDKDLDSTHKTLTRFAGLNELTQLLDADTASILAGTTIHHPCLYFPGSGWLRPSTLRDSILANQHIHFIGNTTITALKKQAGKWHALSSDGSALISDSIVLCNAQAAATLLPESDLPVRTIRGQVTVFPAHGFPPLQTIICHEGYIAPTDPLYPEQFTCGATYELKSTESALLQSSQDENIGELKRYLSDFRTLDENNLPLQGRVEFRCRSSDYLPIIGPVPDTQRFQNTFAAYSRNSKAHIPAFGTYHEGLFINIAHGSRGFGTAPLSAALIRSYIMQQPYPLAFNLTTALNPARFLTRKLVRNKQ